MKLNFTFIFLAFLSGQVFSQVDTCIVEVKKHEISSKYLNQDREYWVSFPLRYDSTKSYPVIYILDGQWRFDLIRPLAFDLAANKKMPGHIIVGLPHKDWRKDRGVDYTFSNSRIEYDGEAVDSTRYNASNSGGGEKFYKHLTEEVMKDVEANYRTNGKNILVGHSYGGYFGTYILSRDNGFTAYQIYDPSIWFSDGEASKMVEQNLSIDKELNVFISYQPVPEFHASKIEDLIKLLGNYSKVKSGAKKYENETHNSLFLYSFLEGMSFLYQDWESED